MNKKIFSILILITLIITIIPVLGLAGSEENPEIKDVIGDSELIFLDIESAWFYEEEENPEYLYISMKINDLKEKFNALFSVRWTLKNEVYVSGLDTHYSKNNVFRSGLRQRATHWQWKNMPECYGLFDTDTDIITWEILKSNIGNPQKGDILHNTEASAVPGFPYSFIYFMLGRDYRDFAPDPSNVYGKDYIIIY
jgi:hypothetical protein